MCAFFEGVHEFNVSNELFAEPLCFLGVSKFSFETRE